MPLPQKKNRYIFLFSAIAAVYTWLKRCPQSRLPIQPVTLAKEQYLMEKLISIVRTVKYDLLLGSTNQIQPAYSCAYLSQLRCNTRITSGSNQDRVIGKYIKQANSWVLKKETIQFKKLMCAPSITATCYMNEAAQRKEQHDQYMALRFMAALNRQVRTGNCINYCYSIVDTLWQQSAKYPKVRRIEILSFTHFDHCICVVNRPVQSDIQNYHSWNCLIIDAWAYRHHQDCIFHSSELEARMKAIFNTHTINILAQEHYQPFCHIKNTIQDINPQQAYCGTLYREFFPYDTNLQEMLDSRDKIANYFLKHVAPKIQARSRLPRPS